MVGTTIGQYKVVERLGEGGMGVVYKARDTKLDRTVAIKVLPPELVADAGRNARFIQEAKAASALNHPNIVTIHDIVSHQAGECIVMEYIEGRPLALLIAQKEMRLSEILRIAAQTADAVAAAHTAGIIHRDLKPANVMVTGSGLVKVVDFGLAKLVSGPGGPAGATMTMPRTDQGTVVGTPGYMSPEQVRGQELDRRSDIFNFGLVLYEMLAGARAFQGDTTADVASAILKESPPDLPDTVPAALRQIVAVCLEKNPVNRFESARDLGHALRAISAGTSLTGALPKVDDESDLKRLWKRISPFAAAAAIIIAAVFAALYFLRRPEPLDLSGYKFTPFATDAGTETNAAWSPDGKSIAYVKYVGKLFQLFIRGLNVPFPTQLTRETAGVTGCPFWSPQGDRIYYISAKKLWSMGVAGGEPQLVLPDVGYAATLSPDGKTLAAWRVVEHEGKINNSLWISSPPGSPPRKYEPAPFEFEKESLPIFLRFSPDGSKICLSEVEGRSLWLLDWPDGPTANPRRLFRNRSFAWPPAIDWLPDSRHLIMTIGGGLWQGDTRTGRLQRLTGSEFVVQSAPSVSPDGERIVYTAQYGDLDIVEIPLDGSSPKAYLATSRLEYSPSWSLAGDRMAFVTNRSGTYEIWLRSASGDWERPIVTQNDFPDEKDPRFENVTLSPDGNRVAYTLRTQTGFAVWISPASGGKPMAAGSGYTPSWSPDGAFLAYIVFTGRGEIAIVRIGSPAAPIVYPDSSARTPPIWSPDGRWIAFGSGQELVLISPDTKNSRRIPCPVRPNNQNFVMVWSRDSSTIYMASSQSETAQLFAVDVKTGRATKIADLGKDVSFGLGINYCLSASLSPDGKSFLTTARTEKADLWILEGFPRPGRLP